MNAKIEDNEELVLDARDVGCSNLNLHGAKATKNDEFYTLYNTIDEQMNAYLARNKNLFKGKIILAPCDDPEWSNFTKWFAAHFESIQCKAFISTSYAKDGEAHGKKYMITGKDVSGDGKINIDDIEWEWLNGDGDFRSDEVTAIRDTADFIITNPPFSLFREFFAWIMESGKKFAIIGSMNAITYKEVFPSIKGNTMWLGYQEEDENGSLKGGNTMNFRIPEGAKGKHERKIRDRSGKELRCEQVSAKWFTNIPHNQRFATNKRKTEKEILKYSSHKKSPKFALWMKKYDNYNAVEIPFSDCIPSDYDGVMGVPISFLTRYNPEEFEMLGADEAEGTGFSNGLWITILTDKKQCVIAGGKIYKRIFIRRK